MSLLDAWSKASISSRCRDAGDPVEIARRYDDRAPMN